MRVTREQAKANRARIVEAAGALFREKGFNGVGVADIMKAANLTHGGFYGHFESKDALAVQAMRAAMEKAAAAWERRTAENPQAPLAGLVDHYLSKAHRDHPHNGCSFASLGADAAREGKAVRATFTEGLRPLIDTLAQSFPSGTKAERRKKALTALSSMVGALVLARAVDDPKLSDDLLAATRKSVLAAAAE